MIKLFGACLIVSAFGIWGVSKSKRLKTRCDSLLSAISSMNLLESEIAFGGKDISAALFSVGMAENMPLFTEIAENLENSTMFAAFSEAVKKSHMCFANADKDVFAEFFTNLGALSKESQIAAISHTRELLSACRHQASEDYRKYGRLYRNTGFLLGLLIAIILI
ncbi:MAG: stage III sporulation protein AB [Clostridia bacterium]|nr:stage III sporulation protein AB [Clostridia bacterium]